MANPPAPASVHVFILAGGSGERFWPLSRQSRPKQFLSFDGGPSLLQRTVHRAAPLCLPEKLTILTHRDLAEATRQHCPGIRVVAEPARRDTGPAAALATALALASDPEAIVVLLPADPWISDDALFREDLATAIAQARTSDALLTLAIPPTHPATGFGYLEASTLPSPGTVFDVRRFIEKPDLANAQSYLRTGGYYWNAGIFVWRADVFLNQCRSLAPTLADFIENWPAGQGIPDDYEQRFAALPKISVDFAVMEKARHVAAVHARFEWDDIGTWTALPARLGTDAQGNSSHGTHVLRDSHRCIVWSSSRPIVLCGTEDLVVVESEDAVLVCHRSRVQEIKHLLPRLPPELH